MTGKGIFGKDGRKLSRAAIAFEKLLPLHLTPEEAERIHLDIFFLSDPETQRGMLAKMKVCPCCKRSMLIGHNGAPADDRETTPYRRQAQIDFDQAAEGKDDR